MSLTLHLDQDIEQRLMTQARTSGESPDAIVNRVLATALPSSKNAPKPFVVEPFALDIPDKWKGLTPTQILHEMDVEEYREKSERARHESAPVCL